MRDEGCSMECSSTPRKAANGTEPTQAAERSYLRIIPAPWARRMGGKGLSGTVGVGGWECKGQVGERHKGEFIPRGAKDRLGKQKEE